jgi:hypothetical protein
MTVNLVKKLLIPVKKEFPKNSRRKKSILLRPPIPYQNKKAHAEA